MKYTLSIAEADGGFKLVCKDKRLYNFDFPTSFIPKSVEKNITVVDPTKLEMNVNNSPDLVEGQQINATCKLPKNGFGDLDLVMAIDGVELTGLSETKNNKEVVVATTATH